jgi:hypothetical protein
MSLESGPRHDLFAEEVDYKDPRWPETFEDIRQDSQVRLVAPRSVLARLRCYHAPRRFQRDVVAHHFPDVILQFCLNAEHGIDSL